MFPLRFYQNVCQSHQYTGSAKPPFFFLILLREILITAFELFFLNF